MKLYKLEIAPPETEGEGEDWSEWFTSLQAARKRRAELIEQDPKLSDHRYGHDYEISRVTFASLPLRELLLAVMNRKGISKSEVVVSYYEPRRGSMEGV